MLDFTDHATASLRTNFAIHHLRAAARAAWSAHEVQQANATAEFGPWFDEMILRVPVSIAMAGPALEAGANEIIQNFLDGSTGFDVKDTFVSPGLDFTLP
jgi:hypothetical protein